MTKDCPTNKDKIIKILLNFRNDTVFAREALSFAISAFLGKDGPIRLKQGAYMSGYVLLLLVMWIMNGITRLTILLTLVFMLSALTFAWVGFFSYDTKQTKLSMDDHS